MSSNPMLCVCPLTGPHDIGCPMEWEDLLGAPYAFGGTSFKGLGSYRTCEHAQELVTLFDGTEVFATAHFDRVLRDDSYPDLCVWLDPAWQSEGRVTMYVDWQDFGLPAMSPESFLRVLRYMLDTARDGGTVETGCLGAHGRTGTLLACLDVVASGDHVSAADSIGWVRRDYCTKAIETKEQEWLVTAIAALVLGLAVPPKPVMPKPKKLKAKKSNTVVIDGLTGKVTSKRADGRTFTYFKGKT